MSNISLMLHVGGTSMAVDMADHFARATDGPRSLATAMATCMHCGALTVDYEIHLVWHITTIKDLSAQVPEQAEDVMPQDVDGDEAGAPERPAERRLHTCRTCGHIHKDPEYCGQPWRGNANNPCPCTVVQ